MQNTNSEREIVSMDERLQALERALRQFLGPNLSELQEVINDLDREVAKRRYIIELPDAHVVDMPLAELGSLVARTSNAYGRAARFAGKCRAEYDLATGAYKRKFEQTRGHGANDAERKANAMAACKQEHLAMTVTEAAYHYAEQLETAARVASESARKIYDKVSSMYVAEGREASSGMSASDDAYTDVGSHPNF